MSFVYDGLDRQLGWQSGGAQLDYQLDGNAPLTETNQTSSRMNLYGNGLVSAGGETLLYDGLGAVRQTTGSSSPAVQWSGSYQAYGAASSTSGSTGTPYKWGAGSGYRSDGFGPTYAAPLQKVGARYYDPEFGCFLTRDTELDESPYLYCDSDPINCTDPDGHKKIVITDPTWKPSTGLTLTVSYKTGTFFSTTTLNVSNSGLFTGTTTGSGSFAGGAYTYSGKTGGGASTFSGTFNYPIYGNFGITDAFGTGNRNQLFFTWRMDKL